MSDRCWTNSQPWVSVGRRCLLHCHKAAGQPMDASCRAHRRHQIDYSVSYTCLCSRPIAILFGRNNNCGCNNSDSRVISNGRGVVPVYIYIYIYVYVQTLTYLFTHACTYRSFACRDPLASTWVRWPYMPFWLKSFAVDHLSSPPRPDAWHLTNLSHR